MDSQAEEQISEFAAPLAMLVVADLLGVPEEDRETFRQVLLSKHGHGAKKGTDMVGSTSDEKLSLYLADQRIAQVAFDGAESYSGPSGAHWTPEGQKLVADRLFDLLSANSLTGAAKASR